MTAEVAIFNREAVALAADSAVTLTGPKGRKIYNTANKLFALSTNEPVAVMVYGNVSFGTIPWTTIIKEFRRKLGSSASPTIDQYASDFFEYILSATMHLSDQALQQQVESKAQWELYRLRGAVEKLLEINTLTDSTLSEREIQDFLIRFIDKRIVSLSSEPVEALSQEEAEQIIDNTIDWPVMLEQSLGEFPINSRIKTDAKTMVSVSLRSISYSPLHSGIIVAGFGTKQCFPAISHRLVDGVIMRTVLTHLAESTQIDDSRSSIVRGFAQKDMVTTFMTGIHPSLQLTSDDHYSGIRRIYDYAVKYLIRHLQVRFSISLSEENILELERQMAQIWTDGIKELEHPIELSINKFVKEHTSQIESIVQWLPQEELAEMAEILVNLTSFKRRVTPEDDTVGGPVDVAVVTKGDGFVWIKHKNFYERGLNL